MLRRKTIEGKQYRIKAVYLCVSWYLGLGWSMPGEV